MDVETFTAAEFAALTGESLFGFGNRDVYVEDSCDPIVGTALADLVGDDGAAEVADDGGMGKEAIPWAEERERLRAKREAREAAKAAPRPARLGLWLGAAATAAAIAIGVGVAARDPAASERRRQRAIEAEQEKARARAMDERARQMEAARAAGASLVAPPDPAPRVEMPHVHGGSKRCGNSWIPSWKTCRGGRGGRRR